ncbi:MAG: circularly permuted type 2 ATP-grasp protein, partial [Acidimicrobiales bacterium]|nr:circularly permuted type 2 ATP-grasp protein [Acidimicrobiales bacterium]
VGNVSVVNVPGSGVLENPGLMPFLADACRALLGEDLRLPSVTTWWCGEEASRRHVLARLEHLVLKSLSASGQRTVAGWALSSAELDELRSRIEARPHLWVAQEPVALGATPTLVDGSLLARRSILRCFVAAREDGYAVMPGGLTRVAPEEGDGLITNQQGAWNKDTWVLAREPEPITGVWLEPGDAPGPAREPATAMSQRAAENLFWLSRYAERAEDLVRQLRVVSDRRTEFP